MSLAFDFTGDADGVVLLRRYSAVPTFDAVDVEFRCGEAGRLAQDEVQAPVEAAHLEGISEVHDACEVDLKEREGRGREEEGNMKEG